MSIDVRANAGNAGLLIPGAYERNTLTYRQPGSMGADGSVAVPIGSSSMDAATVAESEREGGGAPSQRRRTAQVQPWTGPALGRTEGSSSWFKRAGIAFTVLFAGLGAWLGLQLLAASL